MAPLSPAKNHEDQLFAERLGHLANAWSEHLHRVRPAHRHYLTVLATASLVLLSGSVSLSQRERQDPSRRIVEAIGGDLSQRGFRALTQGMTPYSVMLAKANFPGAPEWLPPRADGWETYDLERPPAIISEQPTQDEARVLNDLLPDSPLPNPPMKPFALPAGGGERERALTCLAQAVYYEAGFEPGEGQEAVAQVVLNRLRHPAYPKSVCGVVYEGSQRQTGCQFSFTCDGSLSRPVSQAAWDRSRQVAAKALAGFVYRPVGAATHYHANYVFPYWSLTLVKLRQIGSHIFYRFTGPGGAPTAFTGRYAGGEMNLSAAVLSGGDSRTPDAPAAVKTPEQLTHTITLETGGETRTYTVAGAAPSEGATQGTSFGLKPAPGVTIVPGLPTVLTPTRRPPTAEEIQAINEKMLKFEDAQKRSQLPAPLPVSPANP